MISAAANNVIDSPTTNGEEKKPRNESLRYGNSCNSSWVVVTGKKKCPSPKA